jgi:hypothetical protein
MGEPIGVFEYEIVDYPPQDMAAVVDKLNAMGSEGWQLVHFGNIGSTMRAIFIRQLEPPTA